MIVFNAILEQCDPLTCLSDQTYELIAGVGVSINGKNPEETIKLRNNRHTQNLQNTVILKTRCHLLNDVN